MSEKTTLLGAAFMVGLAVIYKKVLIPRADRESAQASYRIGEVLSDVRKANNATAAVLADRTAAPTIASTTA